MPNSIHQDGLILAWNHCMRVNLWSCKLAYFNSILVQISSSSNFIIIRSFISYRYDGMLSRFSVTSRNSAFKRVSSASASLTKWRSLSCSFSISRMRRFSSQTEQSSILMFPNSALILPRSPALCCSYYSIARSPQGGQLCSYFRVKSAAVACKLQQLMSIFRRAEVSLMSYLYPKKRSDMFRRLTIASALMIVWYQCEYKVDRLIKANEELAKPESFMIDGPDPFKMSRHQWDTVHNHYLNFYYR